MYKFPYSLALATACLAAPMVQAELHFSQPVVDLGNKKRGPSLVQRFVFVQRGKQPVAIVNAKASCGCLAPRLPDRSFAPGETGWLDLEVNTLSQPAGPNTWRADLTYREGDKVRNVTLLLRANLIAEISVQPPSLNLITQDSIAHNIVLTDRRPKPLRITAVQASSPQLKAVVQTPRTAGNGPFRQAVHVEVANDFPEGRHHEVLAVYTDDPAYRLLKVPVTVVKKSKQRIAATPAKVRLRGRKGRAIPARIVLLRDDQEQAVVVDSVDAKNPAIRCKWARGPGAMTTLKIQADHRLLDQDTVQVMLEVQVKAPVRETVFIPVDVVVE